MTTPKIGSPVYAIGSPLGLDRTLTAGLVSSIRKKGEVILIQTSSPISPGSSGGGLFNDRGELLGITTSKLTAGEGLGFAVSASHIPEFRAAAYAAGVLMTFSKMRVATYLGMSEIESNRIQSSRHLTTWLRKTKDENGKALYEIISEKDDVLTAALLKQEISMVEISGQFLLKIARQYIDSIQKSMNGDDHDGRLILDCEVTSLSGKIDHWPMEIDTSAETVNGYPAKITEREIIWTFAKSSSAVLDRYSGILRLKSDTSSYSGKCIRSTKRLF